MATERPSFSVGIEEEYLIVDAETLDLARAPEGLMEACVDALGDKVSPEFLQCQIEVGTAVCETVPEARADLAHLRRTIRDICNEHGVTPIAASTHPFADWSTQQFTDKARYRTLEKDLAAVARRMLICGMHVHVGIENDELRIDLLKQIPYFLPHLLALSVSSPFWEGKNTGLHSYRLTVFDNLPRTGLPPTFVSVDEYRRSVETLVAADVIEDATKIWWDLRPSDRYPTLESRICDVTPRLNDAATLAAVTQCLMAMLYALRTNNQRWRQYDNFLIDENRWRAQRYGTSKGLIDFGTGEIVPFPQMLENLISLLEPYAVQLGCLDALTGLHDIMEHGTSARRQVDTYEAARDEGASDTEALRAVVKLLIRDFSHDL